MRSSYVQRLSGGASCRARGAEERVRLYLHIHENVAFTSQRGYTVHTPFTPLLGHKNSCLRADVPQPLLARHEGWFAGLRGKALTDGRRAARRARLHVCPAPRRLAQIPGGGGARDRGSDDGGVRGGHGRPAHVHGGAYAALESKAEVGTGRRSTGRRGLSEATRDPRRRRPAARPPLPRALAAASAAPALKKLELSSNPASDDAKQAVKDAVNQRKPTE